MCSNNAPINARGRVVNGASPVTKSVAKCSLHTTCTRPRTLVYLFAEQAEGVTNYLLTLYAPLCNFVL